MNNKDFKWWEQFREVNRSYLENEEYRMSCEIYARVNNLPVDYVCKCNPKRIQTMIDELNLKFESQ